MRHDEPLFENTSMNVVPPYGHSRFKPEFLKKFRGMKIEVVLREFLAAEVDNGLVGKRDLFAEVTQHDHSAQRGWQRRYQQTMITARAGDTRETLQRMGGQYRIGVIGPDPWHTILNRVVSYEVFHKIRLRYVLRCSTFRACAYAHRPRLRSADRRWTTASPTRHPQGARATVRDWGCIGTHVQDLQLKGGRRDFRP